MPGTTEMESVLGSTLRRWLELSTWMKTSHSDWKARARPNSGMLRCSSLSKHSAMSIGLMHVSIFAYVCVKSDKSFVSKFKSAETFASLQSENTARIKVSLGSRDSISKFYVFESTL